MPDHSFTPVQERRGVDAKVFREEIVPAGQPVILRGLIEDWPAVQQGKASPLATCEYLAQFYRGKTVPLVLGDPAARRHLFYGPDMARFNFVRRPESLLDCLRLLLSQAENAAAPAIYIDAQPLPDCLPGFTDIHAIPMLDATVVPNIWIGNAVKVQTHFDLKSNIACIVAGRRRFTVFPPDQLPNLYPGPIDFAPGGTPVSMVALDNPDFDRFPKFRQALQTAQVAELEAGDALYLPYAWWHHVESLEGFNVLVNYWWNDVQPATPLYDTLLHAVLAIRDLPDDQRRFWRSLFDYFVFETEGQALGHLAPEHRGHLGPMTPEKVAAIKAILAQAFSQR